MSVPAADQLSLDLKTLNMTPGEFINGKVILNLDCDYPTKQLLIKVEGRKSYTPTAAYKKNPLFN